LLYNEPGVLNCMVSKSSYVSIPTSLNFFGPTTEEFGESFTIL